LKPGDFVVGVLTAAVETKVRPAIVISSSTYLVERPDLLVGILTKKPPPTSTDCPVQDWQAAGLRAPSFFRTYVLTMHRSVLTMHRSESTIIGHLSDRDWIDVKDRVRTALAI
jgi:hypothetical protein